MKAILHWIIAKVAPPDVTKIAPMGASDVATSVFLHGRPRSVQRDAWRGFYASGFITDDRRMRAVRGALWQREGRMQ